MRSIDKKTARVFLYWAMIFKKQDMVKVRKKKNNIDKTAALEKNKTKQKISKRPEKSIVCIESC